MQQRRNCLYKTWQQHDQFEAHEHVVLYDSLCMGLCEKSHICMHTGMNIKESIQRLSTNQVIYRKATSMMMVKVNEIIIPPAILNVFQMI